MSNVLMTLLLCILGAVLSQRVRDRLVVAVMYVALNGWGAARAGFRAGPEISDITATVFTLSANIYECLKAHAWP